MSEQDQPYPKHGPYLKVLYDVVVQFHVYKRNIYTMGTVNIVSSIQNSILLIVKQAVSLINCIIGFSHAAVDSTCAKGKEEGGMPIGICLMARHPH